MQVLALQWRMLHPPLGSPLSESRRGVTVDVVGVPADLTAGRGARVAYRHAAAGLSESARNGGAVSLAAGLWTAYRRALPAAPWLGSGRASGSSGPSGSWPVTRIYYAYPLVPLTAVTVAIGVARMAENRRRLLIGGWMVSFLLCGTFRVGLPLPRLRAALVAWPVALN